MTQQLGFFGMSCVTIPMCWQNKASLYLCGDETSYHFEGFSESGSGINNHVHKKKGLRKGVHTIVANNYHTFMPKQFLSCHKYHPMGEGFTRQGGNDLSTLVGAINTMVMGEEVVLDTGGNILSTFVFGSLI